MSHSKKINDDATVLPAKEGLLEGQGAPEAANSNFVPSKWLLKVPLNAAFWVFLNFSIYEYPSLSSLAPGLICSFDFCQQVLLQTAPVPLNL